MLANVLDSGSGLSRQYSPPRRSYDEMVDGDGAIRPQVARAGSEGLRPGSWLTDR
jgi:hypothetical protein